MYIHVHIKHSSMSAHACPLTIRSTWFNKRIVRAGAAFTNSSRSC